MNTYASFNESLHINKRGTKRKLTEKNSAMFWHKRLGYISKQKIKRLVSDGILDSFDLTNFKVYVECIKRKQANFRKLGANRSSGVLDFLST